MPETIKCTVEPKYGPADADDLSHTIKFRAHDARKILSESGFDAVNNDPAMAEIAERQFKLNIPQGKGRWGGEDAFTDRIGADLDTFFKNVLINGQSVYDIVESDPATQEIEDAVWNSADERGKKYKNDTEREKGHNVEMTRVKLFLMDSVLKDELIKRENLIQLRHPDADPKNPSADDIMVVSPEVKPATLNPFKRLWNWLREAVGAKGTTKYYDKFAEQKVADMQREDMDRQLEKNMRENAKGYESAVMRQLNNDEPIPEDLRREENQRKEREQQENTRKDVSEEFTASKPLTAPQPQQQTQKEQPQKESGGPSKG